MDTQRMTGLDCEDIEAPGHHLVDVGESSTLGEGASTDVRDGSRNGPVEPIDGGTVSGRDGDTQLVAQGGGVGAHLGGFGPLLVGNGDRSSRNHRSL